jgi:hypothetical protein
MEQPVADAELFGRSTVAAQKLPRHPRGFTALDRRVLGFHTVEHQVMAAACETKPHSLVA